MINMEMSTQINDGFSQTSSDGGCLSFDTKYGIMFCAYMPGKHGHYGESRGKVSLSYFPASQPTNIRFVDISEGNDEYLPNILGLGDGKVRVFYEKYSRQEGDHPLCYKDFDYITNTLSEEKNVKVRKADGSVADYGLSVVFSYLESKGLYNHMCMPTEQIGCCTPFRGDDGYVYGGAVSFLAEVALFRSTDNMETVEFFAACPYKAQYELDYRFLNGKIHAMFRTDANGDAIFYTTSSDMGVTWSEPVALRQSIQCRPRMLCYRGHILMAYNYYNTETGNRPEIQDGRTAIRICLGEQDDPNDNLLLADLHSKYGIVNICITDIMNDLYLAYSTSELALEYQNGNPRVRGKDAIRYLKLGDLTQNA